MHSAALADTSNGFETSMSGAQLRRVAGIHAAVVVFYAIDGAFLAALAALGTLPWSVGPLYVALGWCAAAVIVLQFRSSAKRHADLDRNTVAMSVWAAAQMLATALAAPSIAGLMLTSMMTVLATTALQVAARPLVLTWLAFAVGTAVAMLVSAEPFQFPGQTLAHRLLAAIWFAWVLAKCALVNVEGTRLRDQVNAVNAELVRALDDLKTLATTDELTAVANRRSIVAELEAAMQAAPGAVAVVLLDIDRFKQVNDRFGHAAGDAVLRRFAAEVSAGLRNDDRVGRYGGEEFLVVLRQVRSAASARETAERIRASVEAFDWQTSAGGLAVTASAGVARIEVGESAAAAIARADLALYAAKAAGRNRVVLG